MLWCLQTHMHPPRSTQNVWFWKRIHNKYRVENKINSTSHPVCFSFSGILKRKWMWYSVLGSQHRDFQLFFKISYLQRALCCSLSCLWNSNSSEGSNPPRSKCGIFPSVMGLDSGSTSNTKMFSVYCTQVAGIHSREDKVPSLQGDEISGKSLSQCWKETQSDCLLSSLSPK